MTVCVVGAGMAGLACATALRRSGQEVLVLDKGRGPGGRMATRRLTTDLGEVSFDHGAQYFSARHPSFRAQVLRWEKEGLVSPWPSVGEGAWIGYPAMNSPLKAMGRALDVQWNTRVDAISHTSDGWAVRSDTGHVYQAQTLVMALPAEQSATLLMSAVPHLAQRAGQVSSRPCWTVMLAFAEPLSGTQDIFRGDDAQPLGWAARNSSKPGRGSIEAWVIQAGAEWSAQYLEHSSEFVERALMDALAMRLNLELPQTIACSSHRWRYARSGQLGRLPIWEKTLSLGLCGDWTLGPKVEDAWLSGQLLAEMIQPK